MAPRNKSMPPNRVNDTATSSEDASLQDDSAAAAQEQPEVTAEEAWATAEGYTPLYDARLAGGAIFMAVNPNETTTTQEEGEGFSGSFFANASAFAPFENAPWGDEQDSDEGSTQYNTDFRSIADQALQALDEDYSMTLGGAAAPSSTQRETGFAGYDEPSFAAGLKSDTTTADTNQSSNDDGLCLFKDVPSEKDIPPIDTDAVRKAVAAIRLKAPRLTADLNKWEEQHDDETTNTSSLVTAPREHSIIPKTPLSAFWKQSPKAVAATANLSRAATLAEAIRRLSCLESVIERLVIDIVGADHVECSSNEQLRILFGPLVRWIGALQNSPRHISIRLVGPNVPRQAAERPPLDLLPTQKLPTASPLQTATATCHEAVYHEWLQQQEKQDGATFEPPDIAIAFNSGIWGYDEWLPTIKALAESSSRTVPFVSTAYTLQECQDDAEVIENVVGSSLTKQESSSDALEEKCLWKPEANPFASRQIRETATGVPGREYRESAAWQAWQLGGVSN